MKENFEQAKQLIERSQNILLTTHERTDGDDFGSIRALAELFSSMGKNVRIAVRGGVPENLRFILGNHKVTEDISDEESFDLLITSGCSNKGRCGNEKIINLYIPVLNIDHHPDNTYFGQVNLVDPEKSSVAELVHDFFIFCGWPITPSVAMSLLTGIFTDTGSFMHSNTKNETLQAAATLVGKGARLPTIAKHTYQGKNLSTLKAWGRALENSHYDETQQMIYSVITEDDFKDLGNISPSAFEGLVETLNKVPEAKFAMFLKQDGKVVKGSLRSDPYKGINVAGIAKLLGGGGHKWASGFSVAGKLVKDPSGTWQVV